MCELIGRPGRAIAIAIGLMLLANLPGEAYLLDASVYRPPTTGGHAYYSAYGTFGPDHAGFPAAGQSFVDPVFGSTIWRLTSDFPNGSVSDIYAKNGFWNADGTRMIHNTPSGYTIIDTATGAVIRTGVPGNYDGSFAPDDPDTWYYMSGSSIRKYSISAGTTALVKTFGSTLGSLGGSTDWIDASGRYMVLRIGDAARVWDKATDTLYSGNIPVGSDEGWIGISPDARYVVTTNGDVEKYSFAVNHATRSVNTTGVLFWTMCGDHGDLVSASDGKTYLVTAECHSEAAIYAVDVSIPQSADDHDKQRRDNRKLFHYDWNDDMHYSGVAKGALRDWVFVSVESYDDGFTSSVSTWRPYQQEIMMANVLTGELRRLAHHRSRGLGDSYYYQPRVSASWTGAKVAWASNFGYGGTDYADIYAIDVAGAVTSQPPPPDGDDTTPPSVAITAPAGSSTITATRVTVSATATDDVGVTHVAFYANDRPIGTNDQATPYSRVWDTSGLPAGAYTIKAVAHDAAGNTRTATISVILSPSTSTGGPAADVVWTDRKNVAVWGNDVRKSGGCDGCADSGAGSTRAITSGDGYVQFRAVAGPLGYLGLTRGATRYSGGELPFALSFEGEYMSVFESGRYRTDVPFTSRDVFRIQIEDGVVHYKKNGTTFYRSTVAPTYPLRANVVFHASGGLVRDAVLRAATVVSEGTPTTEAVTWVNATNVTVTSSSLTKNAGCDGCPDAGARSVQRITGGRGWLRFRAASPSGFGYVGLTDGAATTDGAALPFAVALEGEIASVYESGVYRADVPLAAGDVFRIVVSAGGVVRYVRNGVVFYRSAVRATYPLRAAAALYDVGTTVIGAVMHGMR
jgi:hypothetical protein